MSIKEYIAALNHHLSLGDATEHTHRPALKSLIESLDHHITATNEPKRRTDCGAPDFIVTRGPVPLGYIEAKDIGLSLDAAEKTDQLGRYREGFGNLILTDYLEFRWYVRPRATKSNEYPKAEHRMTARLATLGKDGRLRVDKKGEMQVLELLKSFLAARVPMVRSAKELAVRMAALARLMRDITYDALRGEAKEGTLHQQMEGFREVLIHDLTALQFADMYAQTICYGLFTARVSNKGSERFTREHAWSDLPKTNPFLRKMFNHIAGPDLDDRIAWAVDDLAELLNVSKMSVILADFGTSTRQEDPVVHFYETFLAAYDPEMREMRGVYYTPEPVVSYIVRSIDRILKSDFKLADGLADSTKITIRKPDRKGTEGVHKVLILDPATGTGTFLYEVIKQIFASFNRNLGMWSAYVSEHLLPRLFGFELLMAPYAVAHMKLGLLLADSGYDFKADERLRVYLTNTLEEAQEVSKLPLFTQWLAEEANEASKIKQEKPVMVVLGNPPYSGHSANVGPWINALLRGKNLHTGNETGNYFAVDGKTLGERNPKWLNDDYVKFIRFAQWRIEQTGYGILAFISNNGYLDNPTFRGMRQSLMETFDDIYVLDLHGSSKKRERAPDGSADENVFDIQQGVAIGLFIKRNSKRRKSRTVQHSDLWGVREIYQRGRELEMTLTGGKYFWLWRNEIATTKWKTIEPQSPFYLFTPQDLDLRAEYETGVKLTNIFVKHSVGLVTSRDDFVFDFDEQALRRRIMEFRSATLSDDEIREKYLSASDKLPVSSARIKIRADADFACAFVRCQYRPFDVRALFYHDAVLERPRRDLMRNMLLGRNLGLISARSNKSQTPDHFFCSRHIMEAKCGEATTQSALFPLYLYRDMSKQPMLGDTIPLAGEARLNLSLDIMSDFALKLRMLFAADKARGDLVETYGSEDFFDYMYAIFYSSAYRTRYADFLKIDFPRLPLTSNVELFRDLCGLGAELVAVHLMEKHGQKITSYPIAGANEVEKLRYTEPTVGDSEDGRVWINRTQYFEGVPLEVWEYQIGGYRPAQKWLKARRGRKLTYDDLTHYQQIISALNQTIHLMSQIDETIEAQGGWPLN